MSHIYYVFIYIYNFFEAVVAQGHKCKATVNAVVVGLIPTWVNEIFHFLALATRQSATLSPNTQHASRIRRSVEYRSVLGTECLHVRFPGSLYYVQDTA